MPGVKRVASEIESPDTLADDEIWRDAKTEPKKSAGSVAQDAWITTDAKVRLIANSDTPARDINVDTLGGVVTLFGTVPTEAARRAAELEVKKVDGVKSVENELQVVPEVSAAAVEHQDERVKDAIEKRLKARDDLSDAKHRRGGGERRRPPDRQGSQSVRPSDGPHARSQHGRRAFGRRRSRGQDPVALEGRRRT